MIRTEGSRRAGKIARMGPAGNGHLSVLIQCETLAFIGGAAPQKRAVSQTLAIGVEPADEDIGGITAVVGPVEGPGGGGKTG